MHTKFIRLYDLFTTELLQRVSILAICFWVPVALFALLANEISEREPIYLDTAILHAIHSTASPSLDYVAMIITNLGSIVFVVPVIIAACLWLSYRHRIDDIRLLLFGTGGAVLMNLVLKSLFQRDRPTLWNTLITEQSYSFPSGHAMASSALAFSLMIIAWRTKWRYPAIIVGSIYFGAVSLSRLYLGVHFPSDVFAGWCVSLAWVLLISQATHSEHRLQRLLRFLPRLHIN